MRTPRSCPATLAVAAGLAVIVATGLASATPASARTCDALKGRDLSTARETKVVAERGTAGLKRYVGCLLPRGRVRLVAQDRFDADSASGSVITIGQAAGPLVAFTARETNADGEGGSSDFFVKDLSRDSRTRYYRGPDDPSGDPAGSPPPTRLVMSGGRFAVLFSLGHTPTEADAALYGQADRSLLVGYAPGRAPKTLDTGGATDIPPASLVLRAATLRWTNAGVVRTGMF